VSRLEHEAGRVTSLLVERHGREERVAAAQVISTMPITGLIGRLAPAVPGPVKSAAAGLHYRAFILAGLIVNRAELFPDNWIYVHSPEVKVGRIQNFKNWSAAMVADPSQTTMGMEYFCGEGDALWRMDDEALLSLARQEVSSLGLARPEEVVDGLVVRQSKAYPVYDGHYRRRLQLLQEYLAGFANLQTIGRNGMHRYNNQDHSMLTGILAARNTLGERHDLWIVNTERSYYEQFTADPTASNPDRSSPYRLVHEPTS
jgi:protoporphyrinogen oxidase